MGLLRAKGRSRDTINFQVEVIYFYGPQIKVDISPETGNTQYFDPSKSISKFDFFRVQYFPKNYTFT